MKSVGILCPSYTLLYRYMHFLENQVRSDPLVCRVSYPSPACRRVNILFLLFFSCPPPPPLMCPPLVAAPLFRCPLIHDTRTKRPSYSFPHKHEVFVRRP